MGTRKIQPSGRDVRIRFALTLILARYVTAAIAIRVLWLISTQIIRSTITSTCIWILSSTHRHGKGRDIRLLLRTRVLMKSELTLSKGINLLIFLFILLLSDYLLLDEMIVRLCHSLITQTLIIA